MKAHPLPDQPYLLSRFSYDPETGLLRWKPIPKTDRFTRTWNTRYAGRVVGSPNEKGQLQVNLDKKILKAHRIIWKMVTGDDIPLVEHRDTDPGNNRWINLRPATKSQNMGNHDGWKKRELPRGVSLSRGLYRAQIFIEGKPKFLGRFKTIEDASAAYRAAAKEVYGEYFR